MTKLKLRAKERAILREMEKEVIALQYDWPRRLRNALKCVRSADPEWRAWCKVHLHQGMSRKEMAQVVEVRARELVLRNYSTIFSESDKQRIIHSDRPFSDIGNLTPG